MFSERRIKIIAGVAIALFFVLSEIFITYLSTKKIEKAESKVIRVDSVSFIAFGDVNLGRTVGKKILAGDTLFPFKKFALQTDSNTILFANLESQLSNQNGETEHPKYNMIFTGPPLGSTALKMGKISVVSTANNHAFDYGKRALLETIENLTNDSILFTGTSNDKKKLYNPLFIKKNNIKFAIFAVTDVMNSAVGWEDFVALTDTAKLFPQIRLFRDSADVIVLSYHGGNEYSEKPSKKIIDFAKKSIEQGVQIFLGHHPHVTYGIEKIGSSFAVHSLGNFVFYQPQFEWTQRSYGVKFIITKNDSNVITIDFQKIIPIRASLQPEAMLDSIEIQKLIHRTQKFSNIRIQ